MLTQIVVALVVSDRKRSEHQQVVRARELEKRERRERWRVGDMGKMHIGLIISQSIEVALQSAGRDMPRVFTINCEDDTAVARKTAFAFRFLLGRPRSSGSSARWLGVCVGLTRACLLCR